MDNIGFILLADDSENDRELTQRVLAQNHLANQIVTVQDGAEALDFLYRRGTFVSREEGDPIIVLLDIKMPKVDGIQVLQKMKADPQLCHIPVVMLTSSRQGPDTEACYRLGANAYVVKPVEFEQFADTVNTIGKFWVVLNEQLHRAAKTAASGS